MMLATDQENKENVLPISKPFQIIATQRNFGTDITRVSLPISQAPADPLKLDYYSPDIFQNLYEIESFFAAKLGYMTIQPDLTEKMRAILIDWLIEVHYKFKLTAETLFLTVNLIDRYLEKTLVRRGQLQLVGVTAMLLASKYEDIYPPEVCDFVNITAKTYSKAEILAMEMSILKTLDYNITTPSTYTFLQRYCRLCGCCEYNRTFARYLIELSLVEYKMIGYRRSLVAAAALYLVHKIKGIKPEWGEDLSLNCPYKEEDLKACTKDVCMILQGVKKSSLKGAKTKFSNEEFLRVGEANIL